MVDKIVKVQLVWNTELLHLLMTHKKKTEVMQVCNRNKDYIVQSWSFSVKRNQVQSAKEEK